MMNTILRTSLRRGPMAVARPLALRSGFNQVRTAANKVSGRPGSQSFEHAATNVKEELGNSAHDFAQKIAGRSGKAGAEESFVHMTGDIIKEVPQPALLMGLAGGLPYIGAGATTVYLAKQAGTAASGMSTMDPGVAITLLHHALDFQVTYGAVLLTFLGGLHWGFEFAGYGGHKGYSRLALGVVPMLIGWPSLALEPMSALIVQWAGFTGLWWADSKVTSAGWAPPWYSQYRFYLSILVGTCIIGSLAGTSYYGPVGGHGLVSHELQELRAERQHVKPERAGLIGGDVSAVPSDEDSYIVVKKTKKEPKEKPEEEEKADK